MCLVVASQLVYVHTISLSINLSLTLKDRLAALTGFRVKYAEAGGVPLWRQFSTKLGDDQGCGREACVTCSQEDAVKVNCFARGIVYESACELCHPGGRKEKEGEGMVKSGKGCYTGESSRSVFERTQEHSDDARKMERDSHQVKHWFLDHPEELDPPKFRIRVIGSYKDAMSREVKEAIRIQNRPGSLNSKGE